MKKKFRGYNPAIPELTDPTLKNVKESQYQMVTAIVFFISAITFAYLAIDLFTFKIENWNIEMEPLRKEIQLGKVLNPDCIIQWTSFLYVIVFICCGIQHLGYYRMAIQDEKLLF